jgi:hypothetical protein
VRTGVRSGWIGTCIGLLYRHTVEMKQMMTRLLARKRAEIRIKEDANLKKMKAEMRTTREFLKEEIRAGQDHLKVCMRAGQVLRNPERRNAGQLRCPSLKEDGQDVLLSRENGRRGRCLRRKVEQNGHHGFGGQSRKVRGRSGAVGSP